MGTFAQKREGRTQRQTVEVKWGKLRLATLAFTVAERMKPTKASVKLGDKLVDAEHMVEGAQVRIALKKLVSLSEGERLEVVIA